MTDGAENTGISATKKAITRDARGTSPLPQFLLPTVLLQLATTIPTGICGVNAKSYLP